MQRGGGRAGAEFRGYIPTLDGWRAVAVAMVVACHCANGAGLAPRWDALGNLAGAEGVSIFFAISGLIITQRLLEERAATGAIHLGRFYLRRACRILPPALFYLAVVAVLSAASVTAVSGRAWTAAALFYRNYVDAPGWTVAHFWSLAVEEHFYLLWPALLAMLGARRAARAGAVLAAAVFAWRWLLQAQGWMGAGVALPLFWERTDTRLDALLFGCLAAIVLDTAAGWGRLRRWIGWPTWWGLAGIWALVALRATKPLSLGASIQAMVLPLILAGTLQHPEWIGARWLEARPLRWIGRLSYSLYLWQELFLGLDRTDALALRVAAALACAAASYYLLERPILRRARKRWGIPGPAPGTTPAAAMAAGAG